MAIYSGHDGDVRRNAEETPDVSRISNPDVGHEKNDVNISAIVKFVGGLAFATFAVFGLMYGMLLVLEQIEKSREAEVSPLARRGEERLPPYPRLQAAPGDKFDPEDMTNDPRLQRKLTDGELDFELKEPMAEWDVLRAVKLRELRTYGKDERSAPGEYRIPVDRAKELLIERSSLSSRQQTGETPVVTPRGTAVSENEVEQMRLTEGYDAQPTYQSAGQKSERRRQ